MTEPHWEPSTPASIERELDRLSNAVAQAEIEMRNVSKRELDAKLQLERDTLFATTDPMCPKPNKGVGGATVAEREDWIRGQVLEAYEYHETCKEELKRMNRYMDRLTEQISIVQTKSKFVVQAYSNAGAGGR